MNLSSSAYAWDRAFAWPQAMPKGDEHLPILFPFGWRRPTIHRQFGRQFRFRRRGGSADHAEPLLAQLRAFISSHRRMMLFLLLFLAGTCIGIWLFLSAPALFSRQLAGLLQLKPISGGLAGCIQEWTASCFSAFILVAALFLAGLSVCGVPVSLAVPFFFGLGIGLTEAYYYAGGKSGILLVALLVLPRTLLAVFALLIAASESMRMSMLLAGQVLPSGGKEGGLWPDFKLYLARFVACVGIVILSGGAEVLLRWICLPWFV